MTFDIESVLAAVNSRAMSRGERMFPYQEDGARWLASRRLALLGDAMGVGKTWELVAATPPRSPVLVTCPSAVKWSWAKTFRFLRPEFAVKVIDRRDDWRVPSPGQVLVCNYELLPPSALELDAAVREIADAIGAAPPAGRRMEYAVRESFLRKLVEAGAPRQASALWSKLNRINEARRVLKVPHPETVLIQDEAHRGKNPDAAVTGRLRQLRDLLGQTQGARIWLATGTPLKNRLDELWEVLTNAHLGRLIFAPEKGASEHTARGQFDIDSLFPDRIATKLRESGAFLRREREEVLPDLPAKTIEVVEVPLDPETNKLADEIVQGLLVAGIDIHTATLEAIETAAMLKIPREMMSRLRARIAAAKVPAMIDLVDDLDDAGVPVVVFCDHLAALKQVTRRDGWAIFSGEQSDEEKELAVTEFQAGKLKGIAVSIRAGGVGITLTHAWRGIFVDLPWVPADLQQAEDRLVRIGQKSNKTLFTRLVADHVLEKRIAALLVEKQALFDRTIGAASVPGRR